MQNGDYEKIYEESAHPAIKSKYSKTEFIQRMKIIANRLRSVDDTLTLRKFDHPYADPDAFPALRNAFRYIEGNNTLIDIEISVDNDSIPNKITDLCVFPESDSDSKDGFCLTEAESGY